MATNPGGMQALLGQLMGGGGQAPPPGTTTGETPGQTLGAPPPQLPMPPTPIATGMDEARAMDRPTKITIRGSQRMLTREALREIVPFLGQFLFNGQMVGALQAMGKTPDYDEFFRMLWDSTGIGKRYSPIRDLNQQEQQALAQPPPNVAAQMQMKQQDAQVRLQIMDKKGEIDRYVADKQAEAKALEAQEDSATEILKLIQAERAALNSGQEEREGARADMLMKIQQKQEELKHMREKHQMDLQHKQASTQFNLQASQQKHEQAMSQDAQRAMLERLLGGPGQRQAGESRPEPKPRPRPAKPGY